MEEVEGALGKQHLGAISATSYHVGGTKSGRCKKLTELIMPKATQPPQCKAALIKFAWEFPLWLEAEKIKCQDWG